MTAFQQVNEEIIRRVESGDHARVALSLWKYIDIQLERDRPDLLWRVFTISVAIEGHEIVIRYTMSEILGHFRTIEKEFRQPTPEVLIAPTPLPVRLLHEIHYEIYRATHPAA